MTARRQAGTAWWRCCAGAALLLWAGQAPAATVSTPMEVSVQPPADAGGAGRTLDKALTGTDSSTAERKLDMALDLQRADLAARNRPGADAAAVPWSAATPPPGQPATPAQALPPPTAGNGMPSALSLGGVSGNDAGLATPRTSGREADPRWNNAQGNAGRSPGGGPGGGSAGSLGNSAQGPSDLGAARRLVAALRDFLLDWRGWLLGGLALVLVAAGLTHLVRTGARHRSGQRAIEQAAQRAGHTGGRSRRSGSRRG